MKLDNRKKLFERSAIFCSWVTCRQTDWWTDEQTKGNA